MKTRLFYCWLVTLLCLYACKRDLDKDYVKGRPIDCSYAVKDPELKVIKKMFKPGYTGEIKKFYGNDSSKLDYKIVVEVGDIVAWYFYDTAQCLQQENHYECEAFHGAQKKYFTNGNVKELLEMNHGIRDGWHQSFYRNGKLRAAEKWDSGKVAGPIQVYDSLGKFMGHAGREAYDSLFWKLERDL